MYPLGPLPRSREAWVLVLADKAAALGDFRQYLRGLINGSSLQIRRRLELSDPYYCQRPRRPRHRLLRRPLLNRPLRQRRRRTSVEP
jgi:glycyl-tRNA synthetase beta chain/uncharacterized protein